MLSRMSSEVQTSRPTGPGVSTQSNGGPRFLQSHSHSFDQLAKVEVGRHEHPLVQLSLPNLFTCMGCKEVGAGRRLSCQSCKFELHDFCATAPPRLKLHPLHPQHQLLLHLPKPSGGGISKSKCDVCGKPTKGYTYRCTVTSCNYQLHPTCAMLSPKLEFPTHPHHTLVLSPSEASRNSRPCAECKRTKKSSSSGQVYTCTVPGCDFLLHATCAKSMVNGLQAHGFKGVGTDKDQRGSSKMLGAAARIASHVVIGFIGGLIEGIGEGVGDALTQDIVSRGGGASKNTRSPIRRRRSFIS